MRTNEISTRSVARVLRRGILLGAGLVLAGGGMARAGGLPSPFDLHREVRRHVGEVLRHLERVPDHIQRQHERHLEVFFGGRSYYAPHRHRHVVYSFPVWIGGVVEYRPYTYCDGRLFGPVSVRPRVWVEWGRDDHGAWCDRCHGYYPQRHAHFAQPSHPHRRGVIRYDDHYDHYDHHDRRGYDPRYDRDDDRRGWKNRHDRDDDRHRGKGRHDRDHH